MRTLLPVRPPAASVKLAARILVAGYVSFAALNAQAAEQPAEDMSRIAAAFGNTVVSTYPDGRTQRIWLHPDGSWDGIGRKGFSLSGRWRLKEDKVCLRQSHPRTLPVSMCVPFPDHGAVGSEWMSHDFGGTPIRLSLRRGGAPAEGSVLGSR